MRPDIIYKFLDLKFASDVFVPFSYYENNGIKAYIIILCCNHQEICRITKYDILPDYYISCSKKLRETMMSWFGTELTVYESAFEQWLKKRHPKIFTNNGIR